MPNTGLVVTSTRKTLLPSQWRRLPEELKDDFFRSAIPRRCRHRELLYEERPRRLSSPSWFVEAEAIEVNEPEVG